MSGEVPRTREGELLGIAHCSITPVVGALVALKIATLFILAWTRRFVMDEFQQFGWAKYIPDQIARLAVQHPKAVGYAFFFDLAHMTGWDARSMLLIGRMETALLACGTLALVYATARALGQTKMRAALIVLVLLSFSNFIERVFETRGDSVAVFFAGAALLVAVRGRDRGWWIFAAGVLSGLAFLSTQKAVYFNLALGLALVGDAMLARRFGQGIARGARLVLGWCIPVAAYCLIFGGGDPLAVAHNLLFGGLAGASSQLPSEYGGLRHFVVQTLERNALLYLFCFAGMAMAAWRIMRLDGARRIALIFSLVITALVFAHNAPWPYVFVMCLPFLALWSLEPFDALAGKKLYVGLAAGVLAVAVAVSVVKNVLYLKIDNHEQLALVARAEKLLAPDDVYFDGVGMLPNRMESSTWWYDRHAVLQTLREGKGSEAYRVFANSPPKVILWSYRMDAIEPVVGPLIRDSYVSIGANLRVAGRRLRAGEAVRFNVPVAGRYALYDAKGEPTAGQVEVDGKLMSVPLQLPRGMRTVALRSGASDALLLPQGTYAGVVSTRGDNRMLFADVYD